MTHRPIKFRAWDLRDSTMHDVHHIEFGEDTMWVAWVTQEKPVMTYESREDDCVLMQFTGLHDKNGLAEVWEGDILDSDGQLIGNRYENETLLQDPSNFLIEGMGTKTWRSTEQAAMERGCKYPQ